LRSRIEVMPSGCWHWTGALQREYGHLEIRVDGRRVAARAHRLVYEALVGDAGENLHHRETCAKRCVNPAHLTPMTVSEHASHHGQQKDACIHGHPLSEAYVVRRSNGTVQRMCSRCAKDSQQRQRDSRKARAGLPLVDLRRKLSADQVEEIRHARAQGVAIADLAARYEITATHVSTLTRDLKMPRSDRLLVPAAVRSIRERDARGESRSALAKEFGVSRRLVGLVADRKRYADVA
jgi:hypothetical protein